MDKEHPKTKRRRRRLPPAKIAAALVLLAVCAGLLYAYLHPDSLRALQRREGGQDLFTYEAGSGQTFAVAGNALAVASSTGIQLIDADGETILRKIFSMDEPAVAACGDRAVFLRCGRHDPPGGGAGRELYHTGHGRGHPLRHPQRGGVYGCVHGGNGLQGPG